MFATSPLDTLPHAQLWLACKLSARVSRCVSSGFSALDAELPGGRCPTQGLSEILSTGPGLLKWRLLAPALTGVLGLSTGLGDAAFQRGSPLRRAVQRLLLLINPPHTPHLPGLHANGLAAQHFIWIRTTTPQQQLWAGEQAVKSNEIAASLRLFGDAPTLHKRIWRGAKQAGFGLSGIA